MVEGRVDRKLENLDSQGTSGKGGSLSTGLGLGRASVCTAKTPDWLKAGLEAQISLLKEIRQ